MKGNLETEYRKWLLENYFQSADSEEFELAANQFDSPDYEEDALFWHEFKLEKGR